MQYRHRGKTATGNNVITEGTELEKKGKTFYALVFNETTTETAKLLVSKPIADFNGETTTELIQLLASSSKSWDAVLKGTKMAVIFDADSLIVMRINFPE